MGVNLRDLNEKRKSDYRKDREEEDFFLEMNKVLMERERKLYRDYPIDHPFLFAFGLPRSGTTLMSQFLASYFDVGYINNLMARFWLAPIHGIRLSKSLIGSKSHSDFESDYARTKNFMDIHEFGYFWRYWLKKESMDDIVHVAEREKDINWQEVRKVLSNIQHEFNKPMVFKNIFGSYHLPKMQEILGKVIFIFINRDPLDVAVSILDARKKHYADLNTWWSYTPLEYNQLKNLDYWEQIAGQVFFLNRYYRNKIDENRLPFVFEVEYEAVCNYPEDVLKQIQKHCFELYNYKLHITQKEIKKFPFRTHQNRTDEKEKFRKLINRFTQENS